MRPVKWIATLLLICMLAASLPFGLTEEQEGSAVDAEVSLAETIDGDTGLYVEGEEEPVYAGDDDGVAAALPAESFAIEAPAANMGYAKVAKQDMEVTFDAGASELIANLCAGDIVLVTGIGSGYVPIAFAAGSAVFEGYADIRNLSLLDDAQTAAYLDDAAKNEQVALYADSLDWPLVSVDESAYVAPTSVLASKYRNYSNDTVFKINGKDIYANLVGSAGSGNCWKWARNLYHIIWGTKFNEKFEGTSSTGYNLLYRLNDGQRKLTPEHLKAFVTRTQPGATIRVCGCTTACPQFNNDGLSCGHNGHSLVIVGKDDEGLYTMDDTGAQHTRYYTWSQFCSSWKSFPYIKYIKWPNAPTIAPSEIPESANEETYSGTFRIKFAASSGVGVYTTPSIGTVSGTLKYPASFTATKRTTTTTAGYYWLYGTSSTGLSGWIAQDASSVVSADSYVDVSGVSLDQKSLRLTEGGTASLKATVSPSNATESAVTWSSSNASVATVNGGSVAAVSKGSAIITASALDGSIKATCAVYVTRTMTTKALSKTGSNGTVTLAPGEQLQLSPTFATKKGWTVSSAKSSKSKVASISKDGVVTAKSSGTTTITVKTKNKKKATVKIKVVDPYAPKKIKLNKKGTVKLKVGGTLQLYTALSPSTAVTTLTWASSNKKVAAVDENGKVVALKKGTATIAVKTANGKLAKVKIKVIK